MNKRNSKKWISPFQTYRNYQFLFYVGLLVLHMSDGKTGLNETLLTCIYQELLNIELYHLRAQTVRLYSLVNQYWKHGWNCKKTET